MRPFPHRGVTRPAAVAAVAGIALAVSVAGVPDGFGRGLAHQSSTTAMTTVREQVMSGSGGRALSGTSMSVSTLRMTNTGLLAARTLSLWSTGCTQGHPNRGAPTDLCSQLRLSVAERDGAGRFVPTAIRDRPLAGLCEHPVALGNGIPAGGSRTFRVSLLLAPSAGDRYQGLQVDDHLVWTVTS